MQNKSTQQPNSLTQQDFLDLARGLTLNIVESKRTKGHFHMRLMMDGAQIDEAEGDRNAILQRIMGHIGRSLMLESGIGRIMTQGNELLDGLDSLRARFGGGRGR